MTPTSLDDHVGVLFQDDVVGLVKVEDGDVAEGRGGAAGLGEVVVLHEMHEGLDDGVVGGVHVRAEREGALAGAEEGLVVVGRYDPVLEKTKE